ncbi:MAG: ribosome biogenesis GTPase Der [Planctomycetes bacterium]|nr:ribosome biogenesis GTPase Der [Planctomycetota bacterium]
MSLPVVAIVGRPNVGKSSLLNCLVGKKISIVDPTPGVTRDRISAPCQVTEGDDPKFVELVDTGGMGIQDLQGLTESVEDQINFALAAADLMLFVVDAREGVTALDRHVAQRLRRQEKPVILVANKVDTLDITGEIGELHALGFGEAMAVSAMHSLGRIDLLEAISAAMGDKATDLPPATMKLAIVGKRNAGKSTFINSLVGSERVIVSSTPGTTRDSVDVEVELDGKRFIVIDTAGVQKAKKFGDLEFYGHHRALRSIRRADVVALMIDASTPVSQVDKDLAGEISRLFKPVVLVVNKWDLAAGKTTGEAFADYFAKTLPEFSYAPVSLTAATEGLNVRRTIDLAEQLFVQANVRVPTAELNRVIETIVQVRGPSHKTGTKPPKILYASQISTAPPTIMCFVNDVRSFDTSYQRFMLNHIREHLPFAEVPIRLFFRQRRPPLGRQAPQKKQKGE